jgi:hypothetical protein
MDIKGKGTFPFALFHFYLSKEMEATMISIFSFFDEMKTI